MIAEETITRRKFTVGEFYQMNDAGFFNEDPRVELVDGQIINMAPIGSYHASVVSRLNELLMQVVAGKFILSIQGPLQVNEQTVLQPDLQILKRREDFYAEKVPDPDDVYLIIEVADSSLKYDSGIKFEMYVKAGIRHYCVVNINDKTVEHYAGRQALRLKVGDTLTITDDALALSLAVKDIFPASKLD